jgi:hypothetical protein
MTESELAQGSQSAFCVAPLGMVKSSVARTFLYHLKRQNVHSNTTAGQQTTRKPFLDANA